MRVPNGSVTSIRLLRPTICILAAIAVASVTLLTACGAGTRGEAGKPTPTIAATAPPAAPTSPPATEARPTVPADPTTPATAIEESGEEATTPPSLPHVSAEELQALAADLVDQAGGFVEVVIARPDGEFIVDINGSEPMEAASLYKLGIMVEVYHQRELGLLSFDDGVLLEPGYFTEGEDVFGYADIGSVVDVDTLLHAMITQSSNVAAAALLALVGNDAINATLASLGIVNTEIRWMPDPAAEPAATDETPAVDASDEDPTSDAEDTPVDDAPVDSGDEAPPDETPTTDIPAEDATEPSGSAGQPVFVAAVNPAYPAWGTGRDDARADGALNVTTAEDIAWLYILLLRGEIMAPAVCQEMLDLLAQQEINDRIPAYLPGDAIVAHKTGNLDGLVHDAGVIYAPSGPIVVVVLTEDIDEGVAVDLIAQVALAAYEAAS